MVGDLGQTVKTSLVLIYPATAAASVTRWCFGYEVFS